MTEFCRHSSLHAPNSKLAFGLGSNTENSNTTVSSHSNSLSSGRPHTAPSSPTLSFKNVGGGTNQQQSTISQRRVRFDLQHKFDRARPHNRSLNSQTRPALKNRDSFSAYEDLTLAMQSSDIFDQEDDRQNIDDENTQEIINHLGAETSEYTSEQQMLLHDKSYQRPLHTNKESYTASSDHQEQFVSSNKVQAVHDSSIRQSVSNTKVSRSSYLSGNVGPTNKRPVFQRHSWSSSTNQEDVLATMPEEEPPLYDRTHTTAIHLAQKHDQRDISRTNSFGKAFEDHRTTVTAPEKNNSALFTKNCVLSEHVHDDHELSTAARTVSKIGESIATPSHHTLIYQGTTTFSRPHANHTRAKIQDSLRGVEEESWHQPQKPARTNRSGNIGAKADVSSSIVSVEREHGFTATHGRVYELSLLREKVRVIIVVSYLIMFFLLIFLSASLCLVD